MSTINFRPLETMDAVILRVICGTNRASGYTLLHFRGAWPVLLAPTHFTDGNTTFAFIALNLAKSYLCL